MIHKREQLTLPELVEQGWRHTKKKLGDCEIYARGHERRVYDPNKKRCVFKYSVHYIGGHK